MFVTRFFDIVSISLNASLEVTLYLFDAKLHYYTAKQFFTTSQTFNTGTPIESQSGWFIPFVADIQTQNDR